MINITNFEHTKLAVKNWQVLENESWCVLGRNGSGKQYLDQLLTGDLLPTSVDKLTLPSADRIGLVSFETQQDIYEHELKMDATDYIDAHDVGTKAKDFLPQDKLNDQLICEFGLTHRLESGYRQLSTGEGRKLLILQAIFNGVELLVCDNPFDSLDEASCVALSSALERLSKTGINVLLMLSNRQDIPTWCSILLLLNVGNLMLLVNLNVMKPSVN